MRSSSAVGRLLLGGGGGLDRLARGLADAVVACLLVVGVGGVVEESLQDVRRRRRRGAAVAQQRLAMNRERALERGRRGEQALLQERHDEVRGGPARRVAAEAPGARRAVGDELGVDLSLGFGVLDLEHHDPAAGKPRRAVVFEQILLEAAHRDLARGLLRRLDPAREAVRVEQLEQRGERVVVAVVRRRRQEQAVLAVRRERADRRRPERVAGIAAARAGRSAVVNLVDDQDVVAARDLRMRRQHLAQQSHPQRTLQPVDRDDQPREVRERVRADATRPAKLAEQLAIDDAKLEAELLAQLIAPLQLQRRGADDERRARAMTQQQLLHDEPCLDRLAEADVIGDQQRRARHPQRAHERFELVVLDRDAAAERRLQRALIGARHRAPADRVQEGVELGRIVEAVSGDHRELCALDDGRAGLDLPDDVELLARRVVLDGDQRDEMLHAAAVERRLRVAHDIADNPHPPADPGELARLRRRGRSGDR